MKPLLNNLVIARLVANLPNTLLQKSHLPYLLVNNTGNDLSYPHGADCVTRTAGPGDWIMVYPGGECYVVNKDKYDRRAALRDMVDVQRVSDERGGAAFTSQSEVNTALDGIIALNPGMDAECLWHIKWVNSALKLRAYQLPEGMGEFEIEIAGEPDMCYQGDGRHCLVVRDGEKDAYTMEEASLYNGWHAVRTNVHGTQLVEGLYQISTAQMERIIWQSQRAHAEMRAAA